MLEPRFLRPTDESPLTFSVCSLVHSAEKYDRLLASFARRGFTVENSKFLAADNRRENRFDGYTWHKHLLAAARGRYVVFCHDDVELIDQGYDDLLAAIAALDVQDPTWLVAGVVGGLWRPNSQTTVIAGVYIDHSGALKRRYTQPCRVETLDECFMLMRRSRPVISSYDLTGFHHYGPDICLQAELLGGSAHVLDFVLQHHGVGHRGPAFRDSRKRFVEKYRRYFAGRILHSTTGQVILDTTE